MPNFSPEDLEIEPYEFVDACSRRELKNLIDHLVDEGHISKEQGMNKSSGVTNPNTNDLIYFESLDALVGVRHLLSNEEEEYIIKLSDKFKHL